MPSFKHPLPSSKRLRFPAGAAALIWENAIDPATQGGIEILARSTEGAQVTPAAGSTAIAIAAVFAPACPCGAGKVDGVRGGIHVCGSDA